MVCILRDFNVIGFFFSYAFHNFGKRKGGTNKGDFFFFFFFLQEVAIGFCCGSF